ncbi:hypothetical protein [Amphritea balenae]|uniref:DUF1302 family protein n=1 Tax=Amphritea balenae TaxID=452629 RepID=A0A3P1SKZ8_9GAMM|nr:hypothetical protein [Amphritea balenae]RRC97828.1 hypothetical protein EHS89_16780 [Amphritea balenae]GGK83333.1 hypothetical protein GCM10007941_37330 [Amphritea balenae]
MLNKTQTVLFPLLLAGSLITNPVMAQLDDQSDNQSSGDARADERNDDSWGDDSWSEEESSVWNGFIEAGTGHRLQDDPALDEEYTLADIRVRLETSGFHNDNRYSLKADFYADGIKHGMRADLREASYSFSATESVDIKLGQQILTWGTGDLLFLNDMFPKDWQSYFAGRDTEYLKAPVTAAKASYFGDTASLDLVWMPDFTSDRYINGDRFSWFSPQVGQNVAAPAGKIDAEEPSNSFANGELAVRISGTVNSNEWALYGYRGFQKQPNGLNALNEPIFTRLDVLGASMRGNLGQGVANAEIALHMADDSAGDDPLKPNDQFRFLLGYERELLPKLTLGVQYYLEQTLDYTALESASASPYHPAQYRNLYTARLNYRMWQDNLIWSLFSYYSPSDDDYFIRPSVSYRFDDNLSMALGGNLFGGDNPHTFFGQFEDASSVYGRIRYAF